VRHDTPGVITIPPLIYAIFLVVGIYWRQLIPVSMGPPGLRSVPGWMLIAAGLALMIWAVATMVRARTTFNPYRPSTALVTTGPFRFTRNPIYLGDVLLYLGIALLFDALLAILLLPVVVAVMHYGVIVREERYLERRFGAEYAAYKSSVRRWL
jgi:protein-S-isoprenylcysteine O-methyltransferase Ste14